MANNGSSADGVDKKINQKNLYGGNSEGILTTCEKPQRNTQRKTLICMVSPDYATAFPRPRTAAFFNGWTRKEAYMKACGKGLSLELNTFSVSLSANGAEEMIQTRHHDQERTRVFTVRGIPSISGYVGAVAAEGRNLTYRFWNWGDPNPSPACGL